MSRASRGSGTNDNTISMLLAVIASLTIMGFVLQSVRRGLTRAVRPLNCITRSRPSNICKYRCTEGRQGGGGGGEISYSNYEEEVKEGESVLHAQVGNFVSAINSCVARGVTRRPELRPCTFTRKRRERVQHAWPPEALCTIAAANG